MQRKTAPGHRQEALPKASTCKTCKSGGGWHFTKKFCFVKLHHMAYFHMKRQDLQRNLYRFSKMSASQTTTKIVKCCKRKSHKARGERPPPWGPRFASPPSSLGTSSPTLLGASPPTMGGLRPPKPPLPPPPHWDGRPVWILQAQEPAPSLGWLPTLGWNVP